MTPDEMKLDMLVAELDYENRLLRARNERLEREAEQRKLWVEPTDEEIDEIYQGAGQNDLKRARAIGALYREKNGWQA